jgi:signal transduction histidine kinase
MLCEFIDCRHIVMKISVIIAVILFSACAGKNDQVLQVTLPPGDLNLSNTPVYIDIEDSGTGIDRKYINEVFKPGFSTKIRGWGLGLSLTKRIIEDYHKGRIEILRSDAESGTVMRVTLTATRKND